MFRSQSIVSNPDPYLMPEIGGLGTGSGNNDTSAKTLSVNGNTINTSIRNLVLITCGQSNCANSFPSNYTPTNSTKIDNLNPYDGAIYLGKDPMLGCSSGGTVPFGPIPAGGNYVGRLADKLINANKFDRIIIVSIAVDGTSVGNWQQLLFQRILAAQKRLAYRGITSATANTTIVKLWGQGESDHGTPLATYTNSLLSVINATRTTGFDVPWFIAKQTMFASVVDTTVQNAQIGIVDNNNKIFAGPDADSISASFRQDGTHFNDTGADIYAGLWQTALGNSGAPF